MKNLTKEAVAKVFELNPDYNKLFFTADGEAFFTENYATQHAKSLEDKTVTPVDKETEFASIDGGGGRPGAAPSAKELIAVIEAVTTVEAYNALELPEGEKRATVVEALAKKKKELGVE